MGIVAACIFILIHACTVNIITESTTPPPMTTSDQQDETSTTQSTEPLDLMTTGSVPEVLNPITM